MPAIPRHAVYPTYRLFSGPLRWRATTECVPSAPITAAASRVVESDSVTRTPSAVASIPRAVTPVLQGAALERACEHIVEYGATNHHERLAEGLDDPLARRPSQPRAVAPAHRARCHPAAGIPDRVPEADVVEGRKCVGPDADPRPGRGVRAAFEDGDVVAAPLQSDGGRQARDACTDDEELLLCHPSKVAPRPTGLYRSNTNSVLVAVATTAPPASVTTPSAKPTRDPAFTTVPVAVSRPLLSLTAFR